MKQLPINTRWSICVANQLCFRCLGTHGAGQRCEAAFCATCSKPHSRWMREEDGKLNTGPERTDRRPRTIPLRCLNRPFPFLPSSGMPANKYDAHFERPILMSLLVSVKSDVNNDNSSVHVHVLLDPGSTTSFISSSAVQRLKLTLFGYALIEMETMTSSAFN